MRLQSWPSVLSTCFLLETRAALYSTGTVHARTDVVQEQWGVKRGNKHAFSQNPTFQAKRLFMNAQRAQSQPRAQSCSYSEAHQNFPRFLHILLDQSLDHLTSVPLGVLNGDASSACCSPGCCRTQSRRGAPPQTVDCQCQSMLAFTAA